MVRRKLKWTTLKRVEFATLCVFGGWMLVTMALWWTPLLEKHRTEVGFAMLFCGAIYLLLGTTRKLQQFRYVPAGTQPETAERLVHLRVLWTAELRLIFTSGFAGTALTLPFFNALRRTMSGLFLLALIVSVVSFALRWHGITKAEKEEAKQ